MNAFCFDPLDYTMGDMLLMGGAITVLRGAAIGFRNDFFGSLGLGNNSVFTAQGTPTRPIAFVDNSLVQEGPFAPGVVYNEFNTLLDEGGVQPYGGQAFFVPATAQDDTSDAAPVLNLRFCDFYMTADDFGIQAGGLPQIGFFSDSGGPLSAASSVVWTMRDCAVYGGQLDLGGETEGSTNAPGSVTWINNLFEGTFITLAPSGVDLPFQAHNNLFRKGILCLTPVSTSQGNWVMKDNLFDQMWFWQSGQGTLNHNYNAFWTNSVPYDMDVSLFGESYFTSLLGSEANGHVLTSAPSYQAGPFGNYYMAQNTPLYQAGSTTADQLGLYHYTTATNQTAEVNSRVDIGLHYLVASNSASGWVPLDTDGDGIPDYVEDANGNGATGAAAVVLGETDWQNPMTDGVNYDPSNAVYLTIDLDGDGLDGAIEQWLRTNPLLPDNPLWFQTPSGVMVVSNTFQYELNLDQNMDTNAGVIMLTIDGSTMNSAVYETNGQWIAQWDTTEITNGIHELNFEVQLTGDDDSTVVASTIVNVQNVISFLNFIPIAGSAIYVEPQTIYANGTWQMNVYDDQANLFASLEGPVDGNGYCDDPDTSQPGISVSILDDQGNQLPSTNYTIELSVTRSEGSGSAGSASSMQVKKTVIVETPWQSYPGKWIVTYQPLFGPNSVNGLNLAAMMFGVIDPIAQSQTYGENSIILSPLQAGNNIPFALASPSDWDQLADNLPQIYPLNARNLFFSATLTTRTLAALQTHLLVSV